MGILPRKIFSNFLDPAEHANQTQLTDFFFFTSIIGTKLECNDITLMAINNEHYQTAGQGRPPLAILMLFIPMLRYLSLSVLSWLLHVNAIDCKTSNGLTTMKPCIGSQYYRGSIPFQ